MGTEVSEIFNYVRRQRNNICSLDQLKDNFGKVINIEVLLTANNCYFFIEKITAKKWQIRSKVPVKLCYKYQKRIGCNGSCNQLHLCRTFLQFNGACSDSCSFSHDLCDEQNRKILSKFKINNDHIEVIRSSFPRICRDFVAAAICNKFNCCKLHICPGFIREDCTPPCKMASRLKLDESILHGLTIRNLTILSLYQILPNEIFANVLWSFNDIPKMTGLHTTRSMTNLSKATQFATSQEKSTSLSNVGLKIKVLDSVGKNTTKRNTVIKKILSLDPVSGCCPLINAEILSLFDDDVMKAEEFFLNENKSFQLIQNPDGNIFVHVCLLAIEPCLFYWGKNGGCRKKCNKFHVCRRYIYGDHDIKTCTFFHLDDQRSKELIREKNLQCFSTNEILTLLRLRFPVVCEKFQLGKCKKEEKFCKDLHICKAYKLVQCKKPNCNLPHEKAYKSPQASNIAKLFHIPLNLLPTYVLICTNDNVKEDFCKRKEVIKAILKINPKFGNCSLSHSKLLTLFNNDEIEAEDYFLCQTKFFRIVENHNGELFVHICLKFMIPCFFYWVKDNGCTDKMCTRFHVCRQYVFNNKHDVTCCNLSHLDDARSQKIIEQNRLENLSKNEILTLFRTRYPAICEKFQEGECADGEKYCRDIHVCEDYVLSSCEDDCFLPHESAFHSSHFKKVAECFHTTPKTLKMLIKLTAIS